MRTSLALLAAAASASAASVSFSNTLTVQGNNLYANLTLGKFDSSLGTLTGVTLTVNEFSVQGDFIATAINGNGTLSAFSTIATLRQALGSGLGFTTATGTADASEDLVITPGLGTVLTQDVAQGFDLTEYIFLQNAVTNVASGNWAAYTGNAGEVVTFQLKNNPSATVSAPTGQFTTTTVTSFADMTVTYTYTPTPVPEASTYGMILGGLALAGAAVRRRQKAAK